MCFLRGTKLSGNFLETRAIVAAYLSVLRLFLWFSQYTFTIKGSASACKKAAVETLCKTGRHIEVQIDMIVYGDFVD